MDDDEPPPSRKREGPHFLMSGPDFDAQLKASAEHGHLKDEFDRIADAFTRLETNVMIRFGFWLGTWRNRVAWAVGVIVTFYALLYAIDRLHEILPWIPDVILPDVPPTPSPSPTPPR